MKAKQGVFPLSGGDELPSLMSQLVTGGDTNDHDQKRR
jgi:hypothetical protein